MESMITLVESSLVVSPLLEANVSAEARPSLLRGAAVGPAPSTPPDATAESETLQNQLMTRSHSEQTTASSGEESGAKMQASFGRRVRESLKRRLKFIGDAIMLTHLHQSTRAIDGYYAVSVA
ncbi:hypothetical protein GGI20_001320 [Coemansia sp. BCRC 34301]|nr:hypothetical protein GGI20_001320 [Coemansia sp. BCRC 34301]